MQVYRTGPTTERLEHRAMTVDDAEVFFGLKSDPEIIRYTGEPPVRSVEEARDAIEQYRDFETVGYGRWACVLRETGGVIGFCGLKYLDDLGEVDIGYRFFPEFWGRGLATEAASATLAYGFERIGLGRIVGLALPENGASLRVLEKIGMSYDGDFDYDGYQVKRYVAERR